VNNVAIHIGHKGEYRCPVSKFNIWSNLKPLPFSPVYIIFNANDCINAMHFGVRTDLIEYKNVWPLRSLRYGLFTLLNFSNASAMTYFRFSVLETLVCIGDKFVY